MVTKEFTWIGNWLAIDFINTESMEEGFPLNRLPDARAFQRWLMEGNVPGARATVLDTPDRDRCWSLALEYRTLLRLGVTAIIRKHSLPANLISKTNMLLADLENVPRIIDDKGRYSLTVRPKFLSPKTLMIPVAQSFAALLVDADHRRLRKCHNPQCIQFFYDTSKSGTRAWCSLDQCGNRLRMAAFREQKRLT